MTTRTTATVHPLLGELLDTLYGAHGTDLHLTVGDRPRMRVDGRLRALDTVPALTVEHVRAVLASVLTQAQIDRLDVERSADFAFSASVASSGRSDTARFRGNAFYQSSTLAVAFRWLPPRVPTPDELGIPDRLVDLVQAHHGLVLITGPTGSGKSTTLASLVEVINQTRDCHVITIEDPVEYLHDHQRALVHQRAIGVDAWGFAEALRDALREDPDVVVIGEMRDLDAIQTTLSLAETGHLVLASLHTAEAPKAIDRIIDVFPGERAELVRLQLSGTLAAVVTQTLVPRTNGGRVAAFEVLVATPAVRNLIHDARTDQLRNVMRTGRREGMQTMEMSLAELAVRGVVEQDIAYRHTVRPTELAQLLRDRSTAHGR